MQMADANRLTQNTASTNFVSARKQWKVTRGDVVGELRERTGSRLKTQPKN